MLINTAHIYSIKSFDYLTGYHKFKITLEASNNKEINFGFPNREEAEKAIKEIMKAKWIDTAKYATFKI